MHLGMGDSTFPNKARQTKKTKVYIWKVQKLESLYTATRVKSRKPYPEGIVQRDDGIVDDTLE